MKNNFSNKNDDIRKKNVLLLNKIINNKKISRKIEKSLYNYSVKLSKERNIIRSWDNIIFRKLYQSKVRSIYTNINPNSYIKNTEFLEKIKNNEIDIEKIAELSVYDIFPENWKEIIIIKSKRDKIKYELKPESMSSNYVCRKCKSKETSYYEVQTRSADEPMTQFITCLNCYNHWKR